MASLKMHFLPFVIQSRIEFLYLRIIIDYLEQQNGVLSAYELKWNMKRKASLPSSFRPAYPDVKFTVVSSENIEELLLDNFDVFCNLGQYKKSNNGYSIIDLGNRRISCIIYLCCVETRKI